MRAKAKRLSSGQSAGKVDASSYEQPTNMNSTKKTGMRPVSPRAYKLGGRIQGDRGPRRADKKSRGNVADEISTRDTKQANRDKFGSPHVGGMKKGGRTRKEGGGGIGALEMLSPIMMGKKLIEGGGSGGDDGASAHANAVKNSQMKKGGKVHDDAAEDKAMVRKMVKPTAMKRAEKQGGGGMTAGEAKAMNRRINDTLDDGRNLKDATYVYRAERRAPRELSPPFIRDRTDRSDPRALRDLERGDYDAMLGVNSKESGMKKGGRTKKQVGGPADKTPYEDAPPPQKAIPGDAPTRGPDTKGGGQATGRPENSQRGFFPAINGLGTKKNGGGVGKSGRTKKQVGGGMDKKAIPGDAPTRGYGPGKSSTDNYEDMPPPPSREPRYPDIYLDAPRAPKYKNLDALMKAESIGGYKSGGGTYYGGTRPTGDRMPKAGGGDVLADAVNRVDDRQGMYPRRVGGSEVARMGKLDYAQRKAEAKNFPRMERADAAALAADREDSEANMVARYGRKKGGRAERKSGGRTKGKTNINIIVNPSKDANDKPPMPGPIPAPPPPMPLPPPPMPPQGPPPGAPPPNMPPPSMMAGMGGGGPPMRARGGRLGMNKIGGSGGGLGRLEKANLR
jgi:hypothetical protein